MKNKIINNKMYFFGDTKNVCECCGTYTKRAFYKNNKISFVKKGKKICEECIERYEFPQIAKTEETILLK